MILLLSRLSLLFCSILGILIPFSNAWNSIELSTTASNKLSSAKALQDFLSRPIHWPEIVASSERVECLSANNKNLDPNLPMRPGSRVSEVFGLGLLSVEWICRQQTPGTFVVESPDGVPGVAKDCAMQFEISDPEVTLTMKYTPTSPIAILATPVLVVDNWIALNVLLPAATDPRPLDSFRALMGRLYGIAGLAHLLDLLVGGSVLFESVGIPVFSELPETAQAFALVWCAMGPLAFVASRSQSSNLADLGLIFYGAVEVAGAYLSGNSQAFGNAILVQGIVLAAWLYSFQKVRTRINGSVL